MSDQQDQVQLVRPSKGMALVYFFIAGTSLLVEWLFGLLGFSTGREPEDFLLLFLGGAFFITGLVELFRRTHTFALTPEGFDENRALSLGVVAWAEVKCFRVKRSLLMHGAEALVFDPVDPKAFWSARRSWRYWIPWMAYWFYGRSNALAWLPLAASAEAAANLLNSHLEAAREQAAGTDEPTP